MHILMVSQYFWPEEFRVNDLAAGLVERGHQVTVLTGQPNYGTGSFAEGYSAFSPRREQVGGVDVVRFPLVARGSGTGARLALNYASFAVSSSILAPFRLRTRFDVALVYQLSPVTMVAPAFVLRALRRLPVVVWVQDLWPDSLRAAGKLQEGRTLRGMRKVVGAMYRRSARVLVQSRAFISAVQAARVPDDRIEYVPNWAEALYQPRAVPADAPERAELPQGFRVIVAGNIGIAQSVETIVAAADKLRDLPDLQWVMIGEGSRRQWLRDEVAARGLDSSFCFIDRRRVEAMPTYFALADVLLVTLARDPAYAATVPSRLQSYLACGRPVIAALEGEGATVVEQSGAGLVCAPEDPDALARAVLAMHDSHRDERAAMGTRARTYYEENFERDMLIDRISAVLDVVATSRP